MGLWLNRERITVQQADKTRLGAGMALSVAFGGSLPLEWWEALFETKGAASAAFQRNAPRDKGQ